jgi:transposase
MEVVREKGVDGLRAKQQPGRPPKLARKKRPRLEEILLKGPMAYGYPDQLWTLKRIAKVIQQEFGVEYHFCNVWKLLRTMGWSCQKPERVAREQDQRAVADWRNKEWSRIQQQAKRGKKDAGLPRRKRLHAAAAGPQDLV